MFGNCFHDGYCRELHLVPHFWKRIHGGDKHGRHHCQCWLLLHLDGCREYGAFRGHRDIWREAWLGKYGIESATLSLCQYRPRLGPFQLLHHREERRVHRTAKRGVRFWLVPDARQCGLYVREHVHRQESRWMELPHPYLSEWLLAFRERKISHVERQLGLRLSGTLEQECGSWWAHRAQPKERNGRRGRPLPPVSHCQGEIDEWVEPIVASSICHKCDGRDVDGCQPFFRNWRRARLDIRGL